MKNPLLKKMIIIESLIIMCACSNALTAMAMGTVNTSISGSSSSQTSQGSGVLQVHKVPEQISLQRIIHPIILLKEETEISGGTGYTVPETEALDKDVTSLEISKWDTSVKISNPKSLGLLVNQVVNIITNIMMIIGVFLLILNIPKYMMALGDDNPQEQSRALHNIVISLAFLSAKVIVIAIFG